MLVCRLTHLTTKKESAADGKKYSASKYDAATGFYERARGRLHSTQPACVTPAANTPGFNQVSLDCVPSDHDVHAQFRNMDNSPQAPSYLSSIRQMSPRDNGKSPSSRLSTIESAFDADEHVRSLTRTPVVDVFVPSVCECGTVVVGVWYLNRPHYCHWFRHPRYAALRSLLEQNRCKSKSRATGKQCSSANFSPTSPAHHVAAAGNVVLEDSVPVEANSAEDLLAPKFLSLLCMFQMIKHQDAVGILYPHTLPESHAPIAPNTRQIKISAHIDCERSKSFVQYRWYSANITTLTNFLSSADKHNNKAVGCCSLSHWKRKPPGREAAKASAQLMVRANLDVKNVRRIYIYMFWNFIMIVMMIISIFVFVIITVLTLIMIGLITSTTTSAHIPPPAWSSPPHMS